MNKLVAIVGRPNVGKSTFFNRMVGQRLSIVNNIPGVTRDRLYADTEWCGHAFTIIDTGGIESIPDDQISKHVKKQAEIAIEMADVVLFMVDGKIGITSDDYEVGEYLRKSNKPIVLVVNKIDGPDDSGIYDFYSLCLGNPFPISSEHGRGIGDVLDAITVHFGARSEIQDSDESAISIAVVGRPNVGKSSLVNKILGYERVIVSDISGTTRDAIDTPFTLNGKRYVIIDTAGIRKKSKVDEDLEYYSVLRAIGAIKRADVVLIVIDAKENITEQDIKICGLSHNEKKASVLVVNKWDIIEKDNNTMTRYEKKLSEELKYMNYLRSVYVSALTGQRIGMIIESVNTVFENATRRIATGILNDVIGDALATNEPPHKNGVKLKIYYATHVAVKPPTFVFFVNEPEILHFSYKRYLENAIRKAFEFSGTPIKLIFRKNSENQ
ncbi:MAG: ribosome biogenesis GTPase Der [Christensenellaceae bacterium]|jgi:GTP-binding protein|nr:ribosome biogenesis GTPase Der [Christensenellaceae bacterium]